MRLKTKRNLVYGFGVNDADYPVCETVGGKPKITCPFYMKWKCMIQRCYSDSYKKKFKTYKDCIVSEEWRFFSNFKEWMSNQDWEGNELDKDFKVLGNKVYSPETCIFIPKSVNSFINYHGSKRGSYPIGVSKPRKLGKYIATCSNPFSKKIEYLGSFSDPADAHLAWKSKKIELAKEMALHQSRGDVAELLLCYASRLSNFDFLKK